MALKIGRVDCRQHPNERTIRLTLMPLNTILVEDSKTILDTLVPALAELA